jgi:hypothetical protein
MLIRLQAERQLLPGTFFNMNHSKSHLPATLLPMSASVMTHVGLVEIILLAVLSAVILCWWAQAGSKGKQLPLPPGPPALPILGNYFDLPNGEKDWLTYRAWGEKYGEYKIAMSEAIL